MLSKKEIVLPLNSGHKYDSSYEIELGLRVNFNLNTQYETYNIRSFANSIVVVNPEEYTMIVNLVPRLNLETNELIINVKISECDDVSTLNYIAAVLADSLTFECSSIQDDVGKRLYIDLTGIYVDKETKQKIQEATVRSEVSNDTE